MDDKLFADLLESVRQGGAMLRGEMEPGRTFRYDAADVAAIRRGTGLSQPDFAAMMGISVGTLRNWEQGRRTPEGPARVLLDVAALHPETLINVARERPLHTYGPSRPPKREGEDAEEG